MANNSTNGTQYITSNNTHFNEELQITNRVILIIYIIGCIGNTLIIIYFIKINRRKMKKMSAYHFLLILLAIVDLNVCAASFAVYLIDILYGYYFGKFLQIFQNPFIETSIYILVIISFLRYKATTNPLEQRWSKKYYFLLSLFSFCCSNGLWLTNVFIIKIPMDFVDLIIFGIVPLIALCFFFIKIYKSLSQDYKNNNSNNNNNSSSNNISNKDISSKNDISCSHNNKNNNNNNKSFSNTNTITITNEQTRRRNIIALNTIKYLIIIFFLTVVVARIVITITNQLNKYQSVRIIELINPIMFDLLYLINNVANVFVYIRFIPGFRRFLWNIVTCKCMK